MIYKPSKKGIKQIDNLNKGYQLIKEGLKMIKDNLHKKDSDVEMQAYKMSKNFDRIIRRVKKLLEKQYIDNEFIDIVNTKTKKRRDGRFDKSGRKSKRKKSKKIKRTKG